jgi:hypothetical protein
MHIMKLPEAEAASAGAGGGDKLIVKNHPDVTEVLDFPDGVILMWRPPPGTATWAIPDGWVLCDGTGGTPDMTDRMVRGCAAGSVGTTGGSDTKTITKANMPVHSHETHAPLAFATVPDSWSYSPVADMGQDYGTNWVNAVFYKPKNAWYLFRGPWNQQQYGFRNIPDTSDIYGEPVENVSLITKPGYLAVYFIMKKSSETDARGQTLLMAKTTDGEGVIRGLGFPAGMIMLWYKRTAAEAIPVGWRLCDEFNGKFPRGRNTTGISGAAGDMGGSDTSLVPYVDHVHTTLMTVKAGKTLDGGGWGMGIWVTVGGSMPEREGASDPLSVLPPYVTLIFIMKL